MHSERSSLLGCKVAAKVEWLPHCHWNQVKLAKSPSMYGRLVLHKKGNLSEASLRIERGGGGIRICCYLFANGHWRLVFFLIRIHALIEQVTQCMGGTRVNLTVLGEL